IAVVNSQGEFLMANHSAHRFFGLNPEGLVGKKMWDVFPPEHADRQMKSIHQVIDTRQGMIVEQETVIQDEKRWFSTNLQPMTTSPGKLPVVQFIARDITDNKKNENYLLERRNFLTGVLDDMLTFVAVLESDGRVVFVNNTPLALINTTLEEVQGTMFQDQKWWSSKPHLQEHIQQGIELCAQGETIKEELEIYTKNGPICIEYSMHPFYDQQGNLQYLVPEGRDISSQKEIEDNLLAEKSKLRTITENAPFGLVLIDAQGSYLYVNPKFEEISGYTLEDVPNGKEWFKKAYPDPETRRKAVSTWIEDFKGSKPGDKASRIFPITSKGGEVKTIYFIPVRLANGEYLMTLEDITKQMHVEWALKESEEKFRTLAQTAMDAIIITDDDGAIIFSNRSLERIFDYNQADILGQTVDILIPERYKADFAGQMEMPLTKHNNGYGKVFESYGLRKDGSEFPLEMSLTAWQMEGKSYTTAILRDITRRKLNEFKMNMREEIFQLMARNIEEVFWMIDPLNGQLLYMSPSYQKIWGSSISELYQNPRSWIESIHPEDQEKFIQHIYGSLEINDLTRMKSMECRLKHPDGTLRWIRIRSFPVINENKQIYRRVGLAKDITYQKSDEEL
ncbi:MAG: PAS domain S-box protein, partial [Methanobacteriaceae archaeon]